MDYKARPRFVPRNYQVDYFGLFDILAYKPAYPLRMISVKPASNAPVAHRKAISAFKPAGNINKELWRFDRDPKNKSKIRRRITVIK